MVENQHILCVLVGCIGGMGLLSAFNYFTQTSQTNKVINKIRETQVDLNDNLTNMSKQTIDTLNEIRESMNLGTIITSEEQREIDLNGSGTWFIETDNVIHNQVTDPLVTITNALSPTSSAGGTVFPTDAIDWFTATESTQFIDKMTLFNTKKQKFAKILLDDLNELMEEGGHLEVPKESEFAMDKFLDPELVYGLADNSNEIADILSRHTQV
jgi:hypothetical protein